MTVKVVKVATPIRPGDEDNATLLRGIILQNLDQARDGAAREGVPTGNVKVLIVVEAEVLTA